MAAWCSAFLQEGITPMEKFQWFLAFIVISCGSQPLISMRIGGKSNDRKNNLPQDVDYCFHKHTY
jgi:hypothetical protein